MSSNICDTNESSKGKGGKTKEKERKKDTTKGKEDMIEKKEKGS
jgi:hypothetical protein